MSNISKIKISGTSYDIKDENACNVVELTQAQYDALPASAKTSNSLFVITDATAGDLSNYYTSAQTQSAITAAVSGKQDTLIAGDNITISGNVISADGGGKAISAGTNISITTGETADTINCTLPISADTNGIYATNSYPFNGNAFKTNNVVFGSNNSINKNGSSSFVSYNFMTGRNNSIGDGGYISSNMNSNFVSGENNIIYPSVNSCSAIFGYWNTTRNFYEFATGKYNNSNTGSTSADNTLFSVGNGTADNARHNAFEIRHNGDIYITLDGQDVKLQDNLGGGGVTSGEVQTMIDASISGKADTSAVTTVSDALTAHTANTTAHTTAAEKTAWDGAVTALGGLKLQQLTQAQYDALVTKDNSTLYVIVN